MRADEIAPPAARPRPKLWVQVVLIAAFYGVYSYTRNLFGSALVDKGQQPVHAFDNAIRIIDIEKALNSNQPPDFTAARGQILKVVNQTLLPTFKKEKLPGYQKDLAHDSQYLETVKKSLKDAGESVP